MGGTITIIKNTQVLNQVPGNGVTATVKGAQPYANPTISISWNAILDKPPFGTASLRDVPASGNASATQVVLGSDTRLPSQIPVPLAEGGTGAVTAPTARLALDVPEEAPANGTSYARQNNAWVALPPGLFTLPLAVSLGGTGADTAAGARTNLGATTVGNGVFTAADGFAARLALGVSSVGDTIFTAPNEATGRAALGALATGDALFLTATAAAARTVLGATSVGNSVFTAVNAGSARTALGSTAVGDAVFIAANAAAARTAIGAGTSSLVLGTTAGTAKEGNYSPALADIQQSSAATGQIPQWNGSVWAPTTISVNPAIQRIPRTSNTALAANNAGAWIDITSGTFAQTFDTAANLGANWFCYLGNSGTGDITLDPAGAETIDGLATYVMYPGEVRIVQCDGTALRSVVLASFNKVFTASGDFIKPPGYGQFGGTLWAGGGGGAAQVQTGTTLNARSGGAGGAGYPFVLSASALAASEAVVIGAGGSAATATGASGGAGTSGGDGGSSTFAGMTNGGGKGGQNSATQTAGGVALNAAIFVGANNAATYANQYNGGAQSLTATALQSIWGGGGGGGFASSAIIAAGSSVFGGNGGATLVTAITGSIGNNGAIPGGGGGLARLDAANGTITSGAGARGELRIWGII